jgi:hypothetical protein
LSIVYSGSYGKAGNLIIDNFEMAKQFYRGAM